ncbi:MAG: hypothetical protein IPL46_08340 [Saprospiraceae bacterium]|nr:hypothetical protein [Saprospiraceae bacterium]
MNESEARSRKTEAGSLWCPVPDVRWWVREANLHSPACRRRLASSAISARAKKYSFEIALVFELSQMGVYHERQKEIPVYYKERYLFNLRLTFLVNAT